MRKTLWATAAGLVIAVILIAVQGCSRKQIENQLIDTVCLAACDGAKHLALDKCVTSCNELSEELQQDCSVACARAIDAGNDLCVEECI